MRRCCGKAMKLTAARIGLLGTTRLGSFNVAKFFRRRMRAAAKSFVGWRHHDDLISAIYNRDAAFFHENKNRTKNL